MLAQDEGAGCALAKMIWWNRHWWFWVCRDGPLPGCDLLRGRPTWVWPDPNLWVDGEWTGWERWWVLDEGNRRWVLPNYWGGLGCSCNDGYCCRMCPHGYHTGPRICPTCGCHGSCRCSNCEHTCCEQVSPRRVVKRLREVLSKKDVLYRRLGEEMLLKIAEFIITEPNRTA